MQSTVGEPKLSYNRDEVIFGIKWQRVYIRHHDDTKARPNQGECSECGRDAAYVAKFPNSTMAEYCYLHMWECGADYLWVMSSDTVFEGLRRTNFKYVEQLVEAF